ncbi:MAG: hypothetical protein Q9181_005488 [Wetmoreana brouardii]
MHMRVQTTLLLLVGFLFALSYAGYSGCSKREVNSVPWIGCRGLSLFKRGGRAKCGKTIGVAPLADNSVGGRNPLYYIPPKAPRDTLPKRELSRFPDTGRNGLNKRILADFPSDKDAQDTFMVEQVQSAATDVVLDPYQNGDKKDDINSGQFRKIGGTDYTKDPDTLGLGRKEDDDGNPIRLTGCTILIVMSEKAVWFGHFWETLAYDVSDEVFQKEVIYFIKKGGWQNPDEQQSLAAHADDFKDQAGASAWILYPVADDVLEDDGTTNHVDYKDKNTKLQHEVLELTGITATMTEYTPDEATNTALGRSLYQYDPNARAPDPNNPDLPVRGFRFIHEYKDEGIHFF